MDSRIRKYARLALLPLATALSRPLADFVTMVR
jgi:hypothetical protein